MAYQFVLPESVNSFYDYFKLNVPIEDITEALGFVFQKQALVLPRTSEAFPREAELRSRLEATLPLVSFTSEVARREMLIAPVLLEVALFLKARLRFEYPLAISDQLRGNLDYFLLTETGFFVVEAKNAEMERGFAQLAAEMAALDKWTKSSKRYLYGAVSIGDTWRFGVLDRQAKTLTQDTTLYFVPQGLSDLLSVLVAIVRGDDAQGV